MIIRSAMLLLYVMLAQSARGAEKSLFVEQHVVKSGAYDGLAIGMTKAQVFSAAARLGAVDIAPSPCDDFMVSKNNINDLPALSTLEGVRLTDVDSYIDIYFNGEQVSRIERSPTASLATPVSIGDKLSVAREKLITALKAKGTLAIYSIVGESSVVPLSQDKPPDPAVTQMHNCWRFELTQVKPAGATYELVFTEDNLLRIVYRRPRIRVD